MAFTRKRRSNASSYRTRTQSRRPKVASLRYKGRSKKTRVVTKTTPAGNALINTIKSVMNAGEEKKVITYNRSLVNVGAITAASVTLDSANYAVLNPSNDTSAGYTIAQGTGNAQRIGNRIRTQKLLFNYTIQPKAYNATSNVVLTPFIIRFYLIKSKINPTQPITISQVLNQIYENGATMSGFTGEIMDLNRKICPDTFTYLTHWDHKVGFSANNQNGINTLQHNANNDFKMAIYSKKNLTKYCNKEVVFDDNGVINNPRLFLLWNIYSMGTSPYGVTQFPCYISYTAQYSYTDA